MSRIYSQIQQSQVQVKDFEKQADEVTQLVTLIRQISEQTNLLALKLRSRQHELVIKEEDSQSSLPR